MVSVLLNSASSKELKYMESYTRRLASVVSEDGWEYHVFLANKEVERFLKTNPLIDIACLDLTVTGGIDSAKQVRCLNAGTFIMIIADASISPMTYISPDIMAASLLLRPFNSEQLKEVVNKTIKTYMKKFSENDVAEDVFVIESREEGKVLLPYSRITCFEAREKKIVAVTDTEEYVFYDTMDNLEKELPKHFVRSHRSFIVNVERVSRVHISQSLIVFDDDTEAPLSRSYKSVFKDILKNTGDL